MLIASRSEAHEGDTANASGGAVALMYHDVMAKGAPDSGFDIAGAELYKLDVDLFRAHLGALNDVADRAPVKFSGGSRASLGSSRRVARESAPFALTFDDGGRSAITTIAPLLEDFGWRGHFFVASDMIGEPSFLTALEVRELHERGHVIGSHSASHPERMSGLSAAGQYEEWKRSAATLESILGVEVRVASVPNGYYSLTVARSAAAAGIEVLFTSEPTTKAIQVDGCLVLGRYSITARTTASAASALIGRSPVDRLRQSYAWTLKKLAKSVAGESYLTVRALLLRRGA